MSESSGRDVVARLRTVRAEIDRSIRDSGRKPGDVTLIAVSKTYFAEAILPVLEDGQRFFGENRVQESQSKWPELKARFPDVELHLIGPLQSNKAKEAVALFDVIETVDRPSIAEALSKEFTKTERRPKLYVQINTGEEAQKAGVLPVEADDFLKRCRDDWHLPIEGLMCIPPVDEPPSPHFALLRKIAERHGIKTLSMGMSADFEAAIQVGATHIRVGSAIFGQRH
jgi:pyridoxal phosphate enzyme (YggS family)